MISALRSDNGDVHENVAEKLACVAWRFCRAGRRSGVAAKFAREARQNERRSREKNKNLKLLPPQSLRGFSALARLYYLARPTKTAMLRRLLKNRLRILLNFFAIIPIRPVT